MSAVPRTALAPLTSKEPEACPRCGSHNVTRRGRRKKKLEIVQLWRCSACKRVLTPGPAALRNKTYPLRMILGALTDYDIGYSLEETAARLKKKTNRTVSPSTISAWLDDYRTHTTYRRLRAEGVRYFPAAQTIRSIKLYHRQIYGFAYHRPKLALLRGGKLDDKRAGGLGSTARFRPLADFLESVPTACPHDLFTRDDDPTMIPRHAPRRLIPRSRTHRARPSIAKRTLPPRRRPSSSQPSATTNCGTRRCSISCSPTTA